MSLAEATTARMGGSDHLARVDQPTDDTGAPRQGTSNSCLALPKSESEKCAMKHPIFLQWGTGGRSPQRHGEHREDLRGLSLWSAESDMPNSQISPRSLCDLCVSAVNVSRRPNGKFGILRDWQFPDILYSGMITSDRPPLFAT
jgi:hypothetical protein